MNSAIYTGLLAHARQKPRRNVFNHGVFMLYLDLDEMNDLSRRLRLFSRNRFNVFSFYDRDHFKFIEVKDETARVIAQEHVKCDPGRYRPLDTKGRVRMLLQDAGQDFELGRVCVLTNPRVFGYVFNPVSFYYCFDAAGAFRALISEVNNTFGDQKVFLYVAEDPTAPFFHTRQRKNFYISPFISYDNTLAWRFNLPRDSILMAVESIRGQEAELKAVFSGRRSDLTDRALLMMNFRYPLLTLMIIIRIHYQALKLFIKGVHFNDKSEQDRLIVRDITRK